MSDYILLAAIGIIAILIIQAIKLISKELQRMHKDIRRTIELGFWNQRRSREILKRIRKI